MLPMVCAQTPKGEGKPGQLVDYTRGWDLVGNPLTRENTPKRQSAPRRGDVCA